MADRQRPLAAPSRPLTAPAGWRSVEFPSDGAFLRGRFYGHPDGAPRATVVMAHGFSATIAGMAADDYAEALQAAGLNVLLYDHKGFGISGGERRHVLNRWTQAVGYGHALDFVATMPSVDPERLAIWGDSMSGGVAICVAAFDQRVRALVVQVPACGSEPPPADSDGNDYQLLLDLYQAGGPRGYPVESTGPMPVVSGDPATTPSLLEPVSAYRWFMRFGSRPETGWANEAVFETVVTPVPLHPGLCAPHLRGPSFWAIATVDEMPGAATAVSRSAFESARHPKELSLIDGGHFGLLYPGRLFDRVSRAQARFLARHLSHEP